MKKSIIIFFSLLSLMFFLNSCGEESEGSPIPPTHDQSSSENESGNESEDLSTGSGTLSDPFNVAAAIEKCKAIGSEGYTRNVYYVRGIAKSINYTSAASSGSITIEMIDEGRSDVFTAYQITSFNGKEFTEHSSVLTVKQNDIVVVKGHLTMHNNSAFTEGGNTAQLVSVNGKTEIIEDKEEDKEDNEEINPNDVIDLGLSVRWAKSPLGKVVYFDGVPYTIEYFMAWGETTTKRYYAAEYEDEYKWGINDSENSPNYGMVKYNGSDGYVTLKPEDDPATALLGKNWRTPTIDEFNELLDPSKCKWENGNFKDSFGNSHNYRVTSKVPGYIGNCIYLDFTGYKYKDQTKWDGQSPEGYYWSSSLYTDKPTMAYALYLDRNNYIMVPKSRYLGIAIYPVTSKK